MFAEKLYILFLILGVIFGGMSLQDYLKNARVLTPAAKVRLRMSIIFLIVGLYLFFSR
jgi:hypothetical protein